MVTRIGYGENISKHSTHINTRNPLYTYTHTKTVASPMAAIQCYTLKSLEWPGLGTRLHIYTHASTHSGSALECIPLKAEVSDVYM